MVVHARVCGPKHSRTSTQLLQEPIPRQRHHVSTRPAPQTGASPPERFPIPFAMHLRHRLAIQIHANRSAPPTIRSVGLSPASAPAREIGPSTTRNHRPHQLRKPGRRHQRRCRARAGPKMPHLQAANLGCRASHSLITSSLPRANGCRSEDAPSANPLAARLRSADRSTASPIRPRSACPPRIDSEGCAASCRFRARTTPRLSPPWER